MHTTQCSAPIGGGTRLHPQSFSTDIKHITAHGKTHILQQRMPLAIKNSHYGFLATLKFQTGFQKLDFRVYICNISDMIVI